MKKNNILGLVFILFIISSLISCKYPDSYIYDLCQTLTAKEEIMALGGEHKNFYQMINFKGQDGTDPLYAAVAEYQDKDLAEFFVSNGADVNVEYLYRGVALGAVKIIFTYVTPLQLAIAIDNYDLVKLLLDNNADVNKNTKISVYHDDKLAYSMDYINAYQLGLIRGSSTDILSLIKNHESFKDTSSYFKTPESIVSICTTEMLEELFE